MRKIWRLKPEEPDIQRELKGSLNISGITARLLSNRGIRTPEEAKAFLSSSLSSCHDPFQLKGMDKAVHRIKQAVRENEKILVYGDYDADGVTSAALVYTALKRLGANVHTYIPNRLEEGYGLNIAAIKRAAANGSSLLVTVDCGTSSFKEVEFAKASGIDIIVTDHHELLNGMLPDAYSVVNPLQEGCPYPFKHLAGVGVAYKLAKAIFEGTPHFAEDFLDLVSLGTVADVAPLIGENRILTKHGLNELSKRGRPGLKALMEVARLNFKDISSGHIGYILGPRINAMGRVGSADKALELILSEVYEDSFALAETIDKENRNRQKIESGILEEAMAKVEREINFKEHRVIVMAGHGWHPGVIGIVASKIADRFYRPTILISLDGKYAKGSGRSIDNFNLFDYLLRCKDTLLSFGGHEAACGITIDKDRVDDFRAEINELAFEIKDDSVFSPKLDIDMEIPLGELDECSINEMETLAPFGTENPKPVLASRGVVVKDGPRKIGKSGFKVWVTDNKVTCEAVSFGRRNDIDMPKPGSSIDIAYSPSINEYQGLRSIQLEIKDIR